MATIQLNLELTDEQYDGLMKNSLDKIIGDDETIEALRTTITTQMSEYLTKHSDIIKDLFYDHNAFGWQTGISGSTKAIVNKAAEGAAKQLEKAVSEYMVDLAKEQDITDLLSHIFMTAILNGAVSGLDRWKDDISQAVAINSAGIQSVRDRLNVTY